MLCYITRLCTGALSTLATPLCSRRSRRQFVAGNGDYSRRFRRLYSSVCTSFRRRQLPRLASC